MTVDEFDTTKVGAYPSCNRYTVFYFLSRWDLRDSQGFWYLVYAIASGMLG